MVPYICKMILLFTESKTSVDYEPTPMRRNKQTQKSTLRFYAQETRVGKGRKGNAAKDGLEYLR